MAADVEGRVVLPLGAHHLAGQPAHPAPEAGDQLEAVGDVLDELVEVGRVAVEDRRAADVDVDRAALGEQRGHVRRRQLIGTFAHPGSTLSRPG